MDEGRGFSLISVPQKFPTKKKMFFLLHGFGKIGRFSEKNPQLLDFPAFPSIILLSGWPPLKLYKHLKRCHENKEEIIFELSTFQVQAVSFREWIAFASTLKSTRKKRQMR